jgi:hypothetical protein
MRRISWRGIALIGVVATAPLCVTSALAAHRASDSRTQCPMRFLAVRQLANGRLPGRRTFTIVGERYRFQCRLYFSLADSINVPGEPPGSGGGGGSNPSESPGVLAWSYGGPCGPHPSVLVYGLLRAPSDSVRVREGHRTIVLRHAPIPAVLHAGGVLVYASMAGWPSELIVRRPDGKRVLDEKLRTGMGNCPPPVGASR